MNAVQRCVRGRCAGNGAGARGGGLGGKIVLLLWPRLDGLSLRNDPRLRAPAAPFHIGFLA
jgi:hypothetical protein